MNLAEKRERVTTGGKGRGEIGGKVGEVTGVVASAPTTAWEMAAGKVEVLLSFHFPFPYFKYKNNYTKLFNLLYFYSHFSVRPNIFVGRVEGSAMYQKWYFEVTVDHIEQTTHMMPHLRIGWANTAG